MSHRQYPFPVTFHNSIPLKFHNRQHSQYPRHSNQQPLNRNTSHRPNCDTHIIQSITSSPTSHPPGFPEPIYKHYEHQKGWDLSDVSKPYYQWGHKSVDNQKNIRDPGGKNEERGIKGEIRTIYISNVSSRCSKNDLIKIAEVFGGVEKVYSHENRRRYDGQFVFVRYSNKQEAEIALKRLKGTRRNGQVWRTDWANRNLLGASDYIGRSELCVGVEDEKVVKMWNHSWLIVSGVPMEREVVIDMLAKEGLKVEKLIRWGIFGFIVVCDDEVMMKKWEQKQGELNSWFTKVMKIGNEVSSLKRFCWIEIQGIPLRAWSMKTLDNIVRKFGNLLAFDRETDQMERIDVARIFVETKRRKKIDEQLEIRYKRQWYKVVVQEINIPFHNLDSKKEDVEDETIDGGRKVLSEMKEVSSEPDQRSTKMNEMKSSKVDNSKEKQDMPDNIGDVEEVGAHTHISDSVSMEHHLSPGIKNFELEESSNATNGEAELKEGSYGDFESPIRAADIFDFSFKDNQQYDIGSRVIETQVHDLRTPGLFSKIENLNTKVVNEEAGDSHSSEKNKDVMVQEDQCICCATFKNCRKEKSNEEKNEESGKQGFHGGQIIAKGFNVSVNELLNSQQHDLRTSVEGVSMSPKKTRGRPKGSKGKIKCKKKIKKEQKGSGRKRKSAKGKKLELKDETTDNIDVSDSYDDVDTGIEVCERVGIKIKDQVSRREKFENFIGDIDSKIKKRKEEKRKEKPALINRV